MESINERIKMLIDDLHITRTAFADRLKVTQAYISRLINTGGNPSERLIEDICEKFNVNEEWLRNGANGTDKTHGMYKVLPEEDETAAIVSDLLEEENPLYDIIKGIMKTYSQLDPKSQEALKDFSEKLLDNLSTKKED